jgi:hypothetical protein
MNDEDMKIIEDTMAALRAAINGHAQIQERMKARALAWTPDMPVQAIRESSMWHGYVQGEGHVLLDIYRRLESMRTTYYEKRTMMQQSPAPPHPDEGQEIPQTPLPDWVKHIDLDMDDGHGS